MAEYSHGIPSWIDIGVTDIDTSVSFYGGLFGWAIPEGDESMGGYRLATIDDKVAVGMSPMQQAPGPPFWTTYVNVDNADEVVGRVAGAGGKVVMEPMDVSDLGRMAILSDPTGAAIGVWQAGSFTGAEIVGEPGAFTWAELVTDDPEACKTFYAAVFGWGDASYSGEMPYTEWQVGDQSVAGMMTKLATMAQVPNHWGVYFAVDDIDRVVSRATDLGGNVVFGTTDSPAGRLATIEDPTGATFNLLEPLPQP